MIPAAINLPALVLLDPRRIPKAPANGGWAAFRPLGTERLRLAGFQF
jgi:hypothetical protein